MTRNPVVQHQLFINLGHEHVLAFTDWNPDLALNLDLRPMADQFPARLGGIVSHWLPDGRRCEGAVFFDVPMARAHFPKRNFWTVECWEPLTLSPSLLCHCGDHGFIRAGQWVPA